MFPVILIINIDGEFTGCFFVAVNYLLVSESAPIIVYSALFLFSIGLFL